MARIIEILSETKHCTYEHCGNEIRHGTTAFHMVGELFCSENCTERYSIDNKLDEVERIDIPTFINYIRSDE